MPCTLSHVARLVAIALLAVLAIASVPAARAAEEKRLYIYNWTDFIGPETIARLAPELLRCLRAGGVVLVSGFERHEAAAVAAEMERRGGAVCETRYKGSWALLVVGVKLVGGV